MEASRPFAPYFCPISTIRPPDTVLTKTIITDRMNGRRTETACTGAAKCAYSIQQKPGKRGRKHKIPFAARSEQRETVTEQTRNRLDVPGETAHGPKTGNGGRAFMPISVLNRCMKGSLPITLGCPMVVINSPIAIKGKQAVEFARRRREGRLPFPDRAAQGIRPEQWPVQAPARRQSAVSDSEAGN